MTKLSEHEHTIETIAKAETLTEERVREIVREELKGLVPPADYWAIADANRQLRSASLLELGNAIADGIEAQFPPALRLLELLHQPKPQNP